ncbi:MAG: S-layer homology domain-containing protein [Solibacillus sp.]
MKKLFLTAGLMVGLFVCPLVSSAAFSDVKDGYWAAPVITELVGKGYMDGYADGTFKPNQLTTRAEAAAVMARTMGISLESSYTCQFTDVAVSNPYYAEIRKLAELGIIQDAALFNPNELLKRAHISKMIALAYEIEVDNKNIAKFKDLPKGYWAKDYIESLADAGVVKGRTATTFEPNSFVTRAHVAALTARGMEFKQKITSYAVAYDYLAKEYIETPHDYAAFEANVLKQVNDIRRAQNLQPFITDVQLSQLAIIKAKDMIKRGYFEHESPHYGHPWDMAALFDYEYTSYGENIARNFKTAKETVDAWMASPKHRANILKPSFTHLGVGVQKTKSGNFYVVQQFSSK